MGGYYASMLGRVVGFRLLVRAAGAHEIHAHSELFVENAFHAQPLGDAHHQPRPQRLALRRILAQFAFDPLLSQILTAGWAADETVQTLAGRTVLRCLGQPVQQLVEFFWL